jgi:hypothetical protein
VKIGLRYTIREKDNGENTLKGKEVAGGWRVLHTD